MVAILRWMVLILGVLCVVAEAMFAGCQCCKDVSLLSRERERETRSTNLILSK